MRALVTRPRVDAEGTAAQLAERGITVLIEPLIDIVPVPGATVEAAGLQGILATSANGIRALARLLPDRTLPVWAVGDASARTARDLGYATVASAGGDVDSLAALVRARVDPAAGALLHAAGSAVAGDLGGRLAASGYAVRRAVLYQARTAERLSQALAGEMATGALNMALFFSPRTAATFVTLVTAAGLAESCGRLTALALSPAVAAALAPLPWRSVLTAAAPTQAALLAVLDQTRLAAGDTRHACPNP